jgi:integrase
MRAKLTDTVVGRLKPEKKVVHDQVTHGLSIHVSPKGKKTWYLRYSIGGKQQRKKLGHFPRLSVRQARVQVKKLNGRIVEGEDPNASSRSMRVSKIQTLGDLVGKYLEDHIKPACSERHYVNRESLVFNHINGGIKTRNKKGKPYTVEVPPDLISKIAIDKVTPGDVLKMAQRIAEKGRKKKKKGIARKAILMVKESYNWAIGTDTIVGISSPCDRKVVKKALKKTYKEVKKERILKDEEWERLHEVLNLRLHRRPGEQGYSEANAVHAARFHLLAGLRNTAVLELDWAQVDLKAETVSFSDGEDTHKSEGLIIPLQPAALDLLKTLHAEEGKPRRGLVFPNSKGKKITSWQRTWNSIRKEAGLLDFRTNDTRHNFITQGIRQEIPKEVMGRLAGQRSQSATARYIHHEHAHLAKSAKKLKLSY